MHLLSFIGFNEYFLPMVYLTYYLRYGLQKNFISSILCRVTNTRAENATKNYGTKFDQIPVDGIPLDLTKSEVKYYIYMERLPAYYLLNIIIPSVVLAFLSAFAFYVPVDSGEKLSLSITILLSFSVFLLILSDNTPNISQGLPYLGKRHAVFGSTKNLLTDACSNLGCFC